MMKKYLLGLLLLLPLGTLAQTPSAPTVLSVSELMSNYGLDTAWVNDTAAMQRYLDEQPQNYVDLTAEDSLVDVGCGKGRAIAFLLREKVPGH